MANQNKQKEVKSTGSRGKITVVMFQLEGDDATLQDAIKVMGQGMEKLSAPIPVYKMISVPQSVRGDSPNKADDGPPTIEGEIDQEDSIDDPNDTDVAEKPAARKRRPQKALTPLKGVDWESGTPFRTYCQHKKPSSNYEKLVVVAGWFKNVREEDTITPEHIAAGFDVMDWVKPENIGGVFRQIKHDKEWFDKGSKPKEWVLAQRGINHLDRMGRTEANGDAQQ